MATNYEKYIHGKRHLVSNCGQDERGRYHGGAAGDQSGREYFSVNGITKGGRVFFVTPTLLHVCSCATWQLMRL